MTRRVVTPLLSSLVTLLVVGACGRQAPPGDLAQSTPSASVVPFAEGPDAAALSDAAGDATADALEAAAPEKHYLAARSQFAHIYAEPRPGSLKLGYLRVGALVERDLKPSAEQGCSKGWYGIRP